MLLLQRHGRMRLRDVMQYAIGYARDGYPMAAGVSAGIAAAEPVFRDHWPTSADGWAAHVIEQLNDNRLIRPRADYLGPEYPSQYVPIDQR